MPICNEASEIIIPPEGLSEVPESTVTVADVTEGCVDGNGIYDVFMQAHVDAIHEEYAKQRIKGSEYSKVYLGGMEVAMTQAVTFALSKDKASTEAELARYEILKASYEIELAKAQICLTYAQIEESKNKAKLTEAQVWTELAKISDDPVNVGAADDVADMRIAGLADIPNITGVYGAQIAKSNEELALVTQKTITEEGQTDSSVFDDESILGRESTVRKYQANGFVRKAEVDAAKLYTDVHSVAMSALDGVDVPGSVGDVETAMEAAYTGADGMDDVT